VPTNYGASASTKMHPCPIFQVYARGRVTGLDRIAIKQGGMVVDSDVFNTKTSFGGDHANDITGPEKGRTHYSNHDQYQDRLCREASQANSPRICVRLRQYYRAGSVKTQGQAEQVRVPTATYFICIALVLSVCVGLVYWTLRLAYANLVSTSKVPGAIQHATTLDPWNAGYFAELAMHSDPKIGDEALRRATELDPLNSAYWIRRGVRAEFAGNPKAAEWLYLEASRVSRLFGPRIMLMNFYFRQGNQEQFWKWAKAAFEVSYGDLDGTFLLCWQMAPDAKVILDQALPKNPAIRAQFLGFVVRQAGVVAARPVADELLSHATVANRVALLDYCEELLVAKRLADAREIWLGLAHRGLVAAIEAGSPKNLVYNAALDASPLQRGFDWRVISNSEVAVAPDGNPGEIGMVLSGNQPEETEVLSQVVALDGSASYRFSLMERTLSHSDPGLTWQIEDVETRRELARLPIGESDDWAGQAVQLKAPQAPFIRLVLKYQRRPGTVRYEGQVLIRQLQLVGGE